jgi:hypothetical protein
MLPHDSQGFLTGETIADIRRIADELSAMRADIALIRRSVMVTGQRLLRQNQNANAGANINPNSSGSSSDSASPQGNGSPPILPPLNGETAGPGRRRRARAGSQSSEERNRDGRGRFTNNGNQDEEERRQKRMFDGLGERLTDAISGSASRLEEVDPTVKAINEVAQPLARGYQWLKGGESGKKEDRWYRRIWRELKLFRRDQTTSNQTEQRILREINENTENQGAGGGGGFIAGLPALIMAGAKGLLKKVPLLGAILGGLGAAFDINATESDDSLSRRQKDERNGASIGGAVGTVGGMLGGAKLGAMAGSFLGPIGTAVGSVVGGAAGLFFGDQAGQILGEVTGFWVSELRNADIPGKIIGTWNQLTDSFKVGWEDIKNRITEKWDEGVKFFTDLWEPIAKFLEDKFGIAKEAANKANAYIKDKTGIDVKAGVTAAAKKAAELAEKGIEEAKKLPAKAGEKLNQAAQWAKENTTVGKGLSKITEWALGQTSKFFESGKGGAGTVSTGKGDFGGASYGTYQLSSKQGTLQEFLKSSGYGSQFEGMKPGTKAFNQRWKSIAQNDPRFGTAQHDFIKASHYDPALAGLKKAGIDLSGRSAAVQDALWSTSVQFGAGNEKKGAVALFLKALAGKDVAKMADQEIVAAVQDYKIANNDRLFSRSSDQVRAGTLNRARKEKTQLLSLAAIESKITPAMPVPAVQSVSAPSPSVPAMPKPQVVAEPPQTMMPIVSDGLRKSLSINIDKDDIGQDISDRRLAHIVTGGLST